MQDAGGERFSFARVRTAARSEMDVYLAGYGGSSSPETACAALVRAWYALASWDAMLRGDSAQDAVAFEQSLARGEREALPPPLRNTEDGFVKAVLACASRGTWSCVAAPSRQEFDEHRLVLLRAFSGLDRRSRHGVPMLPIRWYWATAAAVALVATAGGVFALARPRWRVSYYPNATLSGSPAVVSWATAPDRNWGQAGPGVGLPADHFSARFETCLVLAARANVVFTVGSDDGARLYIDGKEVMSAWINQPFAVHQQSVPVDQGVHYLRLDYYQDTAEARLSFDARFERSASKPILRLPASTEPPCGH